MVGAGVTVTSSMVRPPETFWISIVVVVAFAVKEKDDCFQEGGAGAWNCWFSHSPPPCTLTLPVPVPLFGEFTAQRLIW